jgi:hypothetical protein
MRATEAPNEAKPRAHDRIEDTLIPYLARRSSLWNGNIRPAGEREQWLGRGILPRVTGGTDDPDQVAVDVDTAMGRGVERASRMRAGDSPIWPAIAVRLRIACSCRSWSRRSGLNRGPADYDQRFGGSQWNFLHRPETGNR